jgi:tRNA modification GTPase
MHTEDTIAAIATAPGEGSISIVRLSGPDSLTMAGRILRCAEPPLAERPSNTIVHGFVTDGGRDVDEVLALVMRAPHTYTGEDVVELQGHGGNTSARRILRCALQAGARQAEPGEFTRRAFLNGRLDLVQAEAVLDLVRSVSDRAAEIALQQLEGRLSQILNSIYGNLITVAADLAAAMDFPEDEIHPQIGADSINTLLFVKNNIDTLLSTWNEGRILRNGALVVISGLANVGKSTLLNALLEYDRAIVSPIPGTTRDFIEESICLNGIPIRLVDTAGLRSSDCELEREGVRRAREQMLKADLHLYILDASQPLSSVDTANIADRPRERCILVLNKSDLGLCITPKDLAGHDAIVTSLIEKKGLDQVRALMGSKIEAVEMPSTGDAVSQTAISERHRDLLLKASEEVSAALMMLKRGKEEDQFLASETLRTAVEYVALIIGRVYHDSLLGEIFSRFCIGK